MDSCEHPDFPGAQYERGPTSKNESMFPFEKKIADEIEARCGKQTSPQSGNEGVSSARSGPGS